jgi:hypothetical protein
MTVTLQTVFSIVCFAEKSVVTAIEFVDYE